MTNNLIELGVEISAYVSELQDLQKVIKALDIDIIREATTENKFMMYEVITRYEVVIKKIKCLLESYFEEEKRLGEPSYFSFHLLYKKLIRADAPLGPKNPGA